MVLIKFMTCLPKKGICFCTAVWYRVISAVTNPWYEGWISWMSYYTQLPKLGNVDSNPSQGVLLFMIPSPTLGPPKSNGYTWPYQLWKLKVVLVVLATLSFLSTILKYKLLWIGLIFTIISSCPPLQTTEPDISFTLCQWIQTQHTAFSNETLGFSVRLQMTCWRCQ